MNGKGFAPIAVLLIIAVLVFTGGAVIYQKVLAPQTQTTPNPTITTLPSLTSEPSPTPDQTTGWDSMENVNLGFSVKYPKGWYWEDEERRRLQNYAPQTAPGRGYEPINLDKDRFVINFSDLSEYDKGKNQKIDSVEKLEDIALSDKNTAVYFMGDPAGKKIYTNEELLKINGIDAFYVESSLSEIPWPPSREVYLFNKKSSKVIVASLWPNSGNGKSIFLQILSTFKFLD